MDKEVYTNDSVGRVFNDKYVCVEVQLDTSINDLPEVKKWYAQANAFKEQYQIFEYPSFLFFNAGGMLIYRELGFKKPDAFLKLSEEALKPENDSLSNQLQKYKSGIPTTPSALFFLAKYAQKLGNLQLSKQIASSYIRSVVDTELLDIDKIYFVLDYADDKNLADSLADRYKCSILEQQDDLHALSKSNLLFLSRFPYILNSKDKIFNFLYRYPEKIDSVIDVKNFASRTMEDVIQKEEMDNKLLINEVPIYKNPDWKKIGTIINKKYPKLDSKLIVLNYKIKYYNKLHDWPNYCQALIQRVDDYGAFGPISVTDFNLNNHAWDLFEHATKKQELEKALTWSDSAVNLCKNSNKPNWIDTKANILYKLGRIQDAINLETQAISLDPKSNDFQENLKKMKLGLPTWSE